MSRVAYTPPTANGGSMLDQSGGAGEPLNVIISGLSSPLVLTDGGLENWARSFLYSTEALGIHIGTKQKANTGDGRGYTDEIAVIRQDFGSPELGSLLESVFGGNHFRFWKQVTTGAYFLAASKEMPASENHNIVTNGYNLGRDELVAHATKAGGTKFKGVHYTTQVEYVTGLLAPGSQGINHGIAQDGVVALLTITAA